MYEADIRDLKEQLSAKDNQIRKLQKNNKALRQQFETRKSESKMHYCCFYLFLVVDTEIEDNLRTLQQSPPNMSEEEKAKLDVS